MRLKEGGHAGMQRLFTTARWDEDLVRDHLVTTPTGPRRADVLAAAGAWHRLSCGNGAKGRRWYDWALFATTRPDISLLVRRSVARPSELAFYLCHTPRPVPLAVLVKVAGTRWCVEECFQAGKNEAGLDHYQVRLDKAWYRYVTLAIDLVLAMYGRIRHVDGRPAERAGGGAGVVDVHPVVSAR